MQGKVTTIKGIFVNSHIKFLVKNYGTKALDQLELKMHKKMNFGNWQDVPLSEEIQIIEYVYDIVNSEKKIPASERSFEAGKLHFRNFITTPLGKILFSTLPKNFKATLLKLPIIIKHIFKNIDFSVQTINSNQIIIIVLHVNYPIEHFNGFFFEWMQRWKFKGKIEAKVNSDFSYEYMITW